MNGELSSDCLKFYREKVHTYESFSRSLVEKLLMIAEGEIGNAPVGVLPVPIVVEFSAWGMGIDPTNKNAPSLNRIELSVKHGETILVTAHLGP